MNLGGLKDRHGAPPRGSGLMLSFSVTIPVVLRLKWGKPFWRGSDGNLTSQGTPRW